jgi:hypothetical protein
MGITSSVYTAASSFGSEFHEIHSGTRSLRDHVTGAQLVRCEIADHVQGLARERYGNPLPLVS